MSEEKRIVSLPQTKKAKSGCPVCKRPSDTRYRPFCSARCADVDLGRWFTGSYTLPSNEPVDPEELIGALEKREREKEEE
jgi:endogenous inhibitor of DNA gyrase (YacG/DUF329 family)